MRVGDRVLWLRRQKGGARRVTPIEATVIGETEAGYLVLETERRYRTLVDAVHPRNVTERDPGPAKPTEGVVT